MEVDREIVYPGNWPDDTIQSEKENTPEPETSSDSFGSTFEETDLDVDSDEGEGTYETGSSTHNSKGTQTEWSWMADIVAYSNIRGLNIKDLEQLPYPESVMIDIEDKESCQSGLVKSPSNTTDTDSIAEPPVIRLHPNRNTPQYLAGRKNDMEASTPTILKYVRESELALLDRPCTVPYESHLSYKNAVCRLCDTIIPLVDHTDLPPLYCPDCTELIKSHRIVKTEATGEITMIDINLHRTATDTAESEESNGLLNIRKISSRNMRRLGRERAVAKIKERELVKKLREQDLARQRLHDASDDFAFYDKNMKTISYALSSQRCMEKGWTLKPKKRPGKFPEYSNTGIEMKVDHFTMARETVLTRQYEDGRPFLLFMPDGTGQCYYRSGEQAVSVAAVQPHQFNYVIKSDVIHYKKGDCNGTADPQILACFTPTGYGTCYHSNGVPHLIMTPFGGSVYGPDGSKRKNWAWSDQKHRHSPPLQPLCLALSRYISVRISSQENIILTFSCQQRTARFTVGWKGPLKQDTYSSLKSSTVDSHGRFLKLTQRRMTGLMIAIQEADRYPKSCARRIFPNVELFRAVSAPGKVPGSEVSSDCIT
jgi:hypothetical protein